MLAAGERPLVPGMWDMGFSRYFGITSSVQTRTLGTGRLVGFPNS